MLTVSKRRINKLKKDIDSCVGPEQYRKVIIKAKDGLYLFDLTKDPFYENRYVPIEDEIPGIEVADCSECTLENIIVAGNGKQEPVIILEDFDINLE